ncbi:hypothetical protein RHMOL_Rhmol05G0082700 [Rhododendron molle]|uniref:Uncharacterized protein n=1 Tax=Rhododendron molle TaxID=49168 RepID=A0ACC0NMN4_RHOML|nr:hypothetical protein RHMOL_Rhmol05G0082700 [Rhododendron molle]
MASIAAGDNPYCAGDIGPQSFPFCLLVVVQSHINKLKGYGSTLLASKWYGKLLGVAKENVDAARDLASSDDTVNLGLPESLAAIDGIQNFDWDESALAAIYSTVWGGFRERLSSALEGGLSRKIMKCIGGYCLAWKMWCFNYFPSFATLGGPPTSDLFPNSRKYTRKYKKGQIGRRAELNNELGVRAALSALTANELTRGSEAGYSLEPQIRLPWGSNLCLHDGRRVRQPTSRRRVSHKVGFICNDLKNFFNLSVELKDGDAALGYLYSKADHDPLFFYKYNVDE